MDVDEFKTQIGYEGFWDEMEPEGDAIVDLTVTNTTPGGATMATNNEMKYDIVEVNGEKGVDKFDAMMIIGLRHPTELRNYVMAGKVRCLGEVQAKGKTNKKIYGPMEKIFEARDAHKTRGSDSPERWEIEIHGDVLKAAINEIETDGGRGTLTRELVEVLKKARNLTEERRKYNEAKKA